MTTLDPFSMVYERIVAILKADPTIQSLVRSANWITFDSAPQPLKRAFQPGDAPEILIEPVNGNDQWASTSLSAESTVMWSIKIATNDLRLFFDDPAGSGIKTGVFPLKWALMACLDRAGDGLELVNGATPLPPLPFCRVSRITVSVKSPFDPAGNPVSEGRGTDGWTLLATLTTALDINRGPNGLLWGNIVTSDGELVTSGGGIVTS